MYEPELSRLEQITLSHKIQKIGEQNVIYSNKSKCQRDLDGFMARLVRVIHQEAACNYPYASKHTWKFPEFAPPPCPAHHSLKPASWRYIMRISLSTPVSHTTMNAHTLV